MTTMTTRRAAFTPTSVDTEMRTATLMWSTGARVLRRPFLMEPYYEELSLREGDVDLSRLNGGASVLNSHQRDTLSHVIGTVERAWVEDNRAFARIRFSDRDEVAPIWRDVQNGILRHASVGYSVEQRQDVTDKGAQYRTLRATRWTPMELSLVPVGADAGCGVRSADLSTEDDAMTDHATHTATTEPSAADMTAAIRRTRTEIRALTRKSHLADDFTDDLIDRGLSIEDARAAITDRLATMEPAATVNINASITGGDTGSYDNPDFLRSSIAEALACRHTGLKPSEPARIYTNKRMADIARELLERSGVRTTFMSTNTIIERALHTTSDFSALLGETGQRVLRTAYDAAPAGVRQVARKNTARDFRALTSVQLGEAPTLEKVNEHGEFKSGGMAESKETYSLSTYGKIFGISRQALVNDDLGAFTNMAERLGRAASEFIAQHLVDLLTTGSGAGPSMSDSVALFHATHGNLGSAAAITVASLGTARSSMRLQKGLDKKTPVNATPRFLLVPAAKEVEGEQVLTVLSANTVANVNPFAGSLILVVDPRLDAKSATRWYLFSDPAIVTALEYAFLEDDEGPVISTREGFTVDGVEFKVRLDLGSGAIDHRGAFANPGA